MNQTSIRPWSEEPEDTAKLLNTSVINGLTETEVQARLTRDGENIFESTNGRSPVKIFLTQFSSPLIIILCIAVILTAFLGEWFDSIIVAFAVIINALLGFFQEFKAEKAISSLQSYITQRSRVIRDGQEHEIDSRHLVVGDLIHIKSGSRISADARILKEIDFSADESILTGESLPVGKIIDIMSETTPLPDRKNMVYAGTLAVNGSAYALVTGTGYNTEIGKLALLVSETTTEQTPLQNAIKQLTIAIIVVVTLAVTIIFIIGIMQNQPFFDMLMISIAIMVGSVPEALPIGLTSILAIGVERIAKKKGIMRSLTGAETLGSTSVIITDKTGTLTQADMHLVDIDTAEQLLSHDFNPAVYDEHFSQIQKEILTLARCACDVLIENPENELSDWVFSGSDIEINITKAAARNKIIQTQAERTDIQIRIPFSSHHKFSVTRIPSRYLPNHLNQYEDPHVVMGAPDILLQRSHLDSDTRERLLNAINEHTNHGRRVLGIALYTPHISGNSITVNDVSGLTFMGVLCFRDPIRPEVTSALERIKDYNVRVIMATGDLPGTALSVAQELGWGATINNVLTGQQLAQLSDKELIDIIDKIHIYARVTPEDKLRITRLHQVRGAVVAMTGDGVNDAPSLKAANIGIAVGSGSDVAKGVADLILLDDNFNTIVSTIEEGKQILSNIKKMFVYLMSNALDEIILIGGAIIAGAALPLTAAQIIWVNLFTGSIPAIAFAFDRQPIRETEITNRTFFDKRVIFLTAVIGVLTSILLLVLYLTLNNLDMTLQLAQGIVFACFASYILVIAFSFRDISRPIWQYSLTENKILLFGVIIGLSLTIMTLYVPFFQNAFAIKPLPLLWLGFVVLWIIANVILVEIAKWFANTFLLKT